MLKRNLIFTMIVLGCLTLFTTISALAHNGEVIAVKTTTPMVVDGQDTAGEYAGAALVTIPGPVPTVIKIKTYHDPVTFQERIYLLITVTDATNNNTSDKVRVWLDMLHDGGPTTDDVGFEITRGNTMNKLTGSAGAPTTVVGWVPIAQQKAVVSVAGSWTAELMIQASQPDLNVAFLPSVMGLFFYVRDEPIGGGFPTEDFVPDPLGDVSLPSNLWMDLKTRYPVEFMAVLDQSGSMLSFNRWESAKKAGDVLANTLFALKSGEYIDKLGLVTFKSDCFTDADTTTLPNPLAALPGAFPGNYVTASAPSPNNCTPIGKGLDKAFEGAMADVTLKVVSDPNRKAERIVLLLSDGFHNSPSANVPLQPSQLVYDPCPGTANWDPCPAGVVSRVQVNTVALGSDTNVDTSLLTNIKNRFGGGIFGPIYNIADVSETELLKQFFISSLDDTFQVNSIPFNTLPGVLANEFQLDTAERKLVVILSWNTPGDARAMTLESKPNVAGSFSPVACTTSSIESTAAGYSLCTVNSPPAGIYRATVVGPGTAPSGQFNLVDLKLAASFAIDKQLHGTGQDLLLTARLNEAGVPVTDDATHPVKVTVNIKRPTEGFGTYVSTHEPPSCTAAPPKLPVVDQGQTTFRGVPALVPVSGGEPKPARFAKIDNLFATCGKTSLSFIEQPGVDMFDDGTHGDVTANDGIYSLRIGNAETRFDGSYAFRFRAWGKAPSGTDFARSKTVGEYIRVNVDPGSSTIDSRVVQQVGTVTTREYYVTPRDRFGGYLGPGHSDEVTFTTTAGTFQTPVLDYNNGIYSRVLRLDSSTDHPVVTGTVQGQPVKTGGFSANQGFELFLNIGGTVYQNPLRLNNGFFAGARFGYLFPNQVALEFEGGVTFTRFNAGPFIGRRAKLIQALGNVRYDINQWSVGNWTPYVIGGAGGIFSRGFGSDDSTFAVHGGFGSTYRLTNHVGLRFDGRVFHYGSLNGSGSTTNFQINGGVAFKF